MYSDEIGVHEFPFMYSDLIRVHEFFWLLYLKEGTKQDIRKGKNAPIHCSWYTYIILSRIQSEFMHLIVLGISIAFIWVVDMRQNISSGVRKITFGNS